MFKPNLNPSHPIVFLQKEFKRVVFDEENVPRLAIGGTLVSRFNQENGERYLLLEFPGGASVDSAALFAAHVADRDNVHVVFSNGMRDSRIEVDPSADVEPLGRNDAYEVLGRFATVYGEARLLNVAQVLHIGALARQAMIDAGAINDSPSR